MGETADGGAQAGTREAVAGLIEGVAAAGEGIERMTFKSGDHEEVLFVERKAVVSTADVQEAWAEILPSTRCISIRLKPEGAKRMAAVTGEMKLGVERLAVVVDGKPKAALVVQDKLGANFIIEGFDDLTDDQLKEPPAEFGMPRASGNTTKAGRFSFPLPRP